MELDLDRFRKCWALVERGAGDGERAAAMAAAQRVAEAAGLSIEEAVSKMDAAAQSAPSPEFTFRTMSEDEFFAEEISRSQRKWNDAVARYGPPGDLFEETEREGLLRDALMPLATWKKYSNCNELFVDGFHGWRWGPPTGDVLEAVRRAYPLPITIPDALTEWRAWEDLAVRRERYSDGEPRPWVRVRVYALEHLLDILPVRDWSDMDVRLEWRQHLFDREFSRSYEEERQDLDRLRADLEFLRSAAVQSGQAGATASDGAAPYRSTAQKRRDVLDLLTAEPNLTDREVARRCGVSPTTVGNLRRKVNGSSMPLFTERVA